MLSRTKLLTAILLGTLSVKNLIFCLGRVTGAAETRQAGAERWGDTAGDSVSRHHQQYWQQQKYRNNSVLSLEIDCAVRKFALEFAMGNLPWSSSSQKKHVFDALRLHECPTVKEQETEKYYPDDRAGSFTEPEGKSKTSAAQKIRHRSRLVEESRRSPNKAGPSQQQETKNNDNKIGEPNEEDIEAHDSILIYVDPKHGDDKAPGTLASPLKTIENAITASRDRRRSLSFQSTVVTTATIVLREGRYYLEDPLRLDARDNHLTIRAYQGETPILSGGDPLSLTLFPTSENHSIYSAALVPPRKNKVPGNTMDGSVSGEGEFCYNFTMLFLDRSEFHQDDIRLVWAREPNGHPERDLQPDGYANANGTDYGNWPDAQGAIHVVVGKNDGTSRNSTIYPWHGEDLDPRGGGNWLHFGGTGNRFVDGKGYWNGTVPRGMKFRREDLNTSGWTPKGYAPSIAHIFHNALWGNWQFQIDSITTDTSHSQEKDGRISFKRGGWQEGRGGGIREQPFFVEGVKEALDIPGEWWLDVPNQVLYYYPHKNETSRMRNNVEDGSDSHAEIKIDFVAPRLKQLIEVVGGNSEDKIAEGITFSGLTFAHTDTTFLEPYEVPSPGDWSIHRGGAVFLENAHDTSIVDCIFIRTGGNAVVLSGHTKRSYLSRNEFSWIGDSAIVTLGKFSMVDGFTVDTFPDNNVIEENHFREIGIHGKQTSALFSALSCRTTFAKNVLYNGPRAGINLNDQFCHGHTIQNNLLFNWVRETQDHGPINTWDRAMYIQKGESEKDGKVNPTFVPQWAHIERNFILNGPSGNRDLGNLFPTIDNDDGSSYFYIANNFLVYGGGKNYLGHDKIWISNLFVHPGRWSGEGCAQIWGGENHLFAQNTCIVAQGSPPIGLDGSMKGFACMIDWTDSVNNLPFVGKTANNTYYLSRSETWGFGCGNGTSANHWFTIDEMQKHGWELGSTVKDSNLLTPDRIIELAKTFLTSSGGNGEDD